MGKRKTLSKKIRFEVFKRDKFTCQYCGRMAPDVVLEVDHIKPVAEGGNDGILNLITSCRDCNRGKGKVRLSDNQEVKKQQNQMKELAEKREQMEMLMEWRTELADYENSQVTDLCEYIFTLTGQVPNDYGRARLKKLIRSFSFTEVVEAIDISFPYYYDGSDESWNDAFNKIGGICYNRRKQGDV